MSRIRVVLPHPVVKDHHVKHTAGLLTIGGTILELTHAIPYAGVILLGIGGCIAIYEPNIVHYVVDPHEEDDTEEQII